VSKKPATAPSSRRIQTRRSGVHGKGVFAVQDIAAGETLIERGRDHRWDGRRAPPEHLLLPCRQDRVMMLCTVATRRVDQPQLRPHAKPMRRTGAFIKALRDIAAGEGSIHDTAWSSTALRPS
jgi:hypothetical protein